MSFPAVASVVRLALVTGEAVQPAYIDDDVNKRREKKRTLKVIF